MPENVVLRSSSSVLVVDVGGASLVSIIPSQKDQIRAHLRTNTNNNTNRSHPLNKIESLCLLSCE